jgi:hypothetical protein
MGTRSLLGYEIPNGKIYVQYMQYDGNPATKGREFYEGVTSCLREMIQNGKTPNSKFFARIKHFLNNYQYQTAHSIGNHFITSIKEWGFPKQGGYVQLDYGQEWQYLFKLNGDFVFFPVEKNARTITIPWLLTLKAVPGLRTTVNFEKFWDTAGKLSELDEHKKILGWNNVELCLHLKDEFEYESSKEILESAFKGIRPKVQYPELSLDYGEVQAFPDQGVGGFRNWAILKINGRKVYSSMFADRKEYMRNNGTVKTKID